MGTRGVFGFKISGKLKVVYNQYDSNYSGLGEDIVSFCRQKIDLRILKKNVTNLQEMTEAEINEENDRMGQKAASPLDDPKEFCEAVYLGLVEKFPQASEFMDDTLFCEYGYVINLDNKTLEIFRKGNELIYTFPMKKIPVNWVTLVKNEEEGPSKRSPSLTPTYSPTCRPSKKTKKAPKPAAKKTSKVPFTIALDTSGSISEKDFSTFMDLFKEFGLLTAKEGKK